MEIALGLLLIQALCVFVIDYTGAVEEMLTPIVKRLTGAKIGTIGKPFNCSLCSTFWLGLIWLLVKGSFTLPYIGFVAVLAALTPVTLDIIWFVRDFLQAIVGWLRYITGLK